MPFVNFIVARRLHFETVSRHLAQTDGNSGYVVTRLRRLIESFVMMSPSWVILFGFYGYLTFDSRSRELIVVLLYFFVASASAYLLLESPTSKVCTEKRLERSVVRQMESDFLMMSVAWSLLLFVTVLNALHPGALSYGDKEIVSAAGVGFAFTTLGVGTLLIRRGLSRQLRKLGMEMSR